ncbi:sulfate permease-like protein [Bimuria novae-zelandiae CBS 107.79]|uniref:Sulfate permease-like protein n=1 Tax=Bimuria novae-zelandiae CBS 107.79 TaxID=1447943 RepID=A0A6A5UXI8_9PLEO|nr:sulfate permease-like protein [Bimuria novae-zelandiae CBS 107.79]
MGFASKTKQLVAEDHTIQRVRRDGARAARALPRVTGKYLVDKVPVVQWAPQYNPRWLLNDALAGITVGVLLIPQALAYAKIATIPGEFGLMSSWLPNFLYFFMGTSKDMSTGPTSLMGLLTAEIVRDYTSEGFSAQSIASMVAMCVGIYCLVIGGLKLGFLLEFVSEPVLHGFISAAGIVIMLGQIPSLFGVKVGSGTANIIHDLVTQIPDFKPPTVGIGFGSIFLLIALQKLGQKWGSKNKAVWFIALARSAIVLVLFTGISYAVNKNIDLKNDDPVWELSKVKSDGISAPKMPPNALFSRVFPRAVAPFLAAVIEHLAIAKAFARRNGYVIDPAQELVYLGVTNFFNSFFSAMPVGGAMSRTAVNSSAGVKSPAYAIVAGGVVILSIFELSSALFWIPKATLAAIIVTAVWSILSPPKVFWHFWKVSLVDFIAAMLAFWLTLFESSEIGIGCAVAFQLVYHILCTAFARVRRVTALPYNIDPALTDVPANTLVFKPHTSLIFYNAFSTTTQVFDAIQTYASGEHVSFEVARATRTWSTTGERRANELRKQAGIVLEPARLRVVVVDMSMVTTVDTTGLTALQDLKADVERYAGKAAEVRFANVYPSVRERFERFGWSLWDSEMDFHHGMVVEERKGNAVFESVSKAVRQRRMGAENEPEEFMVVGSEKV